jgi:hypothetical protein
MADRSDVAVVGFDLGHGESAVAWCKSRATNAPTVVALTGASGSGKQQVTAVAEHADRGVLVGEEAVNALGVDSLYLAFKSPQLERPEVRHPVELFVGRIRDDVVGNSPVPANGDAKWVFGAPSGWSATLRTDYRSVLGVVGFGDVEVVPESRAALLYARDSEEVSVSAGQIAGTVLICDLGSSTSDFTYVTGFRMQPVDRGTQLGAHLIDKTIRDRAIATSPQRAELEELIHEDRFWRLRLELLCRQAKEAFFRTDPGRFVANPGETVIRTRRIETRHGRLYFTVELSADDMREVLDTPQPALDGQSWRAAFEADLGAVAGAIGHAPDFVLLTGGASRMGFVQEVARDMFGADRVKLGSEPELAIARGLALAGRMSVRAAGFRADIHRLTGGDQVSSLIEARVPDFAKRMGDAAAAGMTDRYVVPAFRRWRNGEITTLHDMATEIATSLHADLTDGANPRLAQVAAEWQDSLRPELEELTRPICNRWHLPPAAMELPPTEVRPVRGDVRVNTNLDAATEVLGNVATAVNVVVAGVVATTLFGAGTALIFTTGPVGVVIAFVAAMIGLAVGREAALEKAKEANLPLWMRRLGSEDKLIAKLRLGATAEEAELSRKLADQFLADSGPHLNSEISEAIVVKLEAQATEAELLIS